MGWSFQDGASKQDIIDQLTKTWDAGEHIYETIRSTCKGNTLYSVREITNKETGAKSRFIGVDLLQGKRGYGYGYKGMNESCGPCEVDCPLAYFDMVPCPDSQFAREWRETVKETAMRKAEQKKLLANLKEGDEIELQNSVIKTLKITRIAGTKVYGAIETGKIYRVPRTMIKAVIS